MSRRCCGRDDDLRDALCRNLGRMCTIFTTAGGRAGDGFTGILSEVDGETCRLVSPFGFNGRRGRCGCGGREDFGSTQVIPIDSITCLSTPSF